MDKTKSSLNIRKLTLCAMLTAVVAVGTAAIAIPIPFTGGYINLGDGIILAIAYLLGAPYAMIAGGIGSALADVFAGYAQWAPFTLIIKGLMGYTAARIFIRGGKPYSLRSWAAVIVAELIMIGGYYLAGIVFTSPLISLQSIPANCVQAIGGGAVYFVLAVSMENALNTVIRQENH